MYFRRTSIACAIALLLTTCTSCQLEALDPDGDGTISVSEFLSAAFDFVCGGQDEQDEPVAPDDETPDDENQDDETPVDETPDAGIGSDEIPESGF